MSDITELGELTKVKLHGLKHKAPPSSVGSSSSPSAKRKKFKSDDNCSMLSLTPSLAYGAYDNSDPDDPNGEKMDNESLSTNEKPLNFVNLDTSSLNRENGILFSEDLTDKYEIWSLQCPDDIDINSLQDKKINFDEVSSLKIPNTMSTKVDLIPYKSQENTTITIVTPSEETKQLSLNVVPLAGTIILSNRVKKVKLENQKLLPVDTIEEATKRRSELMTKITERLSKKNDINSTKILTKKEIKSPKKIAKKRSLNKSDRVEEVKLEYHNLLPVDTTKDATGQQSELKSEIIQTNHMDIQIKNEIPTPKKKKKKKK